MPALELSADELLLLTTIRIETTTKEGICTGTGFFFELKHDAEKKMGIPVIVTNKHVIHNALTGKLRFSLKDSDGNPLWGDSLEVQFDNFEQAWIMHPEEDVDLCILPIASIHQDIRKDKKELLYATLTVDNIPSSDEIKNNFSRIEDVTVIGYPDGIWDSVNNIPITRRGITATPLQVDFENTPRFFIDAAIYGGSSGSPVFIFNQGTYSIPKKGVYMGNRIKLVGIVYAVAQHAVTGELKIVDIPASKTQVARTLIPNNLGVAIHARKLLDFEAILPEVKADS